MDRDHLEIRSISIELAAEYAVARPAAASGTRPALLLIFHGWGQSCRSIMRRFQPLRNNNVLLVAPQAPHPFYVSMNPKKVGFTWLTQYERDRAVDEFRDYIRRLTERLHAEETFDASRIFLAGYSQGVSMAYRLAVSDVLTPAGLIACNADLPPDVTELLPNAPRFPVLLIHGNNDPLVPVAKFEDASETLRSHGFIVEAYLHDGGHELPDNAIQHIASWIENMTPRPRP